MKTLLPHQQRVIKEYEILSTKLEALGKFLESAKFKGLRASDSLNLLEQHKAMGAYLNILQRRIQAFTGPIQEDTVKEGSYRTEKEFTIKKAKELRVEIDNALQNVKDFKNCCLGSCCMDTPPHAFANPSEVPANIQLASRHLEDAIMRLGMTLKAIGNPTPYPKSYDPTSNVVEPTADGLKL